MSTLTGKKFKNYYKSLLHLEDELPLTSTKKVVQDGDGNALPFKVSSLGVEFTGNVEGVTKTHVGLGSVDNTADSAKPVSTLQAAADTAVANAASTDATTKANAAVVTSNAYSDGLITALKDGVATPGNTLQKLYNLILGAKEQVNVANIAARDAYNITAGFNVFVNDDGDGKWAVYYATTSGVAATYVKLSDPDLLNAVMSAASIKAAYESNADTNALTNALLAKLNAIEASADVTDAANVGSAINGSSAKTTPVDADKIPMINSVGGLLNYFTWANLKATLVNTWKDTTGGFVGMTLFKINFKNAANTITSFFENANTVARTYTFPDKDGIVAMTSDISGGAGGAYILKTANYTLTDTEAEGIVDCTGTHTQTLPTAVGRSGKKFTIKNSGTGIITVNTTSSQTIDGATSVRINTRYNTRTFQSDGANWVVVNIAFMNIQTFPSSDTWYKPQGAKQCQVIALGGGGAGGSGRRGAVSTLRCGGGGGGSGQLVSLLLEASAFGDTEVVTVGAGGIGANAITADDTNGNTGGSAGDTTIGSIIKAYRGFSGQGGTAATSSQGGGGQGLNNPQMQVLGATGGGGSTTANGGAGGNQDVYIAPSAGGGGGGVDASNNVRNGGVGGRIQQNGAAGGLNCPLLLFANVTSVAANNNGGVSIALPNYGGFTVGGGGAGGNGSIVAAANKGGDAGGPGAGGGGGGASLNGNNSGAGGNGGDGWVVIITYF